MPKPDTILPPPAVVDVDARGPATGWRCRHCRAGEAGVQLTTRARGLRRLAHEALCPDRPDTPHTAAEMDALSSYLAPLLRDRVAALREEAADLQRARDDNPARQLAA